MTAPDRDSHAWCDICKAPSAAPCYGFHDLKRRQVESKREIAAATQRIAAKWSEVSRLATGPRAQAVEKQRLAAHWYTMAREAAGVEE